MDCLVKSKSIDAFVALNYQNLLDQIGVEGVRLLSCWVHEVTS